MLFGAIAAMAWLTGCEAPLSYLHTGIATEATGRAASSDSTGEPRPDLVAIHASNGIIGNPAPEFLFLNQGQQLKRFKDIRGRITILAFADDPNWPHLDVLRQLREDVDNVAPSDIEIVLVVVGSPGGPCEESLAAIRATPVEMATMFVICDPSGAIRDRYGPDAKGRFFMVDNLGKLADKGDFASRRLLQHKVSETVDELRRYDIFFITD